MNLILVEPGEVGSDGRAVLTGARARHVATVLGAAPGREVRIGLRDGALGVGLVGACSVESVVLTCCFDGAEPERPAVDLLLALPRPKVMQRLWAQLAALGVGRILLTNAERVERLYFDTHVLEPDTYRPLLIEGLQQARDTRVPDVSVHKQFRVLVEDQLDEWCPTPIRLVSEPGAGMSPREVIATATERVLLAVGPEGGWNRFELDLLASRGFRTVGLGARTLRSDTAAVALLAVVHAALAERRGGDHSDRGAGPSG